MGSNSANSLAPGFRFHPTDEELVRYYLKRKVCGKSFRFDAISQIEVYKSEPWDLPDKAKLKTRDLEWYFFSVLDKKYGNGSKTNRATENGYWKTTGKDRAVYHNSKIVGMKKTLVFHSGRAPRGARTNWVMHEYRLVDDELEKAGISQDAFVLCRIFQKSGTGPKNGEKYGAPFFEEEWNEEEVRVPGEQDEVEFDDVNVEDNDLEQKLDMSLLSESDPLLLDFSYGETSNYPHVSREFIKDNQNPLLGIIEDFPSDQNHAYLQDHNEMEVKLEIDDYLLEPPSNNVAESDFLLDEPYFDANGDFQFNDDGLFLETNDLMENVEAEAPSNFDLIEEYLSYLEADTEIMENIPFDSSKVIGTENSPDFEQTYLDLKTETDQFSMSPKQLLNVRGDYASSSEKKYEAAKWDSDNEQYPFSKKAMQMLGNIPAPPAYASEFATKEAAALRFNSQSSSSVHFATTDSTGNGVDMSFGKNGTVDLILSFAIPQGGDISSFPPSGKSLSAVSRSLFYCLFFWVIVLSASYKIGTCVRAR